MNHESKCRHLHGHNYIAFVTVEANELDGLGRVIDFSVIKELVGNWIDLNWDHGFILNFEDKETRKLLRDFIPDGKEPQKVYLLPGNPTAENIAKHLMEMSKTLLPTDIKVSEVVVWETENCCATIGD